MKTKFLLPIPVLLSVFTAMDLYAGQGAQPSICNRACWGARNGTCTTTMTGLTRAIIHHTANTGDFTTDYESAKAKMRSTQGYHMDTKGWCDIGYHFMTSAGGHIFEGRKGAMTSLIKGNHAGCGNVNSFGFTFLGYFHPPYNQNPPVAMRNAMYDVIAWRMPSAWSPYGGRTSYSGSLNGTAAPLDTHQWVGASTGSGCSSTACPGDVIINNYITGNFNGGEMRDGINARKNPPPPVGNLWSVATTKNADGRMQIFARGPAGSLRTMWQLVPNGAWSAWLDLGGGILGVPAAGTNQDGRIQVFVRGLDNTVYTMWQTSPNGGFSGWIGLGGSCATDPAVSNNADSRLQVFTRATDNTLWTSWQTAPNSGFSGWLGLGGSCYSVPTPGINADGRIQVFTRAGDNTLWTMWQMAPNGNFSSWLGLGGSCIDAPAVGKNADGRLQAFTRAGDNTVWSIWQTVPNGGFSGWLGMGGSCFSAPGVGSNADGRVQVFTHAWDNTVLSAWQTVANGGFTGWSGFGGSCQAAPSVGYNPDGRMQVFTRATDNTVWTSWQTGINGTWGPWAGWGN